MVDGCVYRLEASEINLSCCVIRTPVEAEAIRTPVEAEATGWGKGDEHVQGEWVSCIERAEGGITNTEGVGRVEAEEPGKDQWERREEIQEHWT